MTYHDVTRLLTGRVLTSFHAFLVSAIQLGLTFMKMGQVRTKNTTNILLKSIIDSCKFNFQLLR